MKKIFWLASYPKSGNTWLRAILCSLFFSKNGKFDFSLLSKIQYFDELKNYDFVKNINIEDFNNLHLLSHISKYWLKAQELVDINGDSAFFKTHSANIICDNKYHYTTNKTTRGVILIIRDPRDVVVSYANFQNKSIDETIKIVTDSNIVTKSKDSEFGLPMAQLNWEAYYRSWFVLDVPKLLIKYEDMLIDPQKSIEILISFFKNKFNINFNNENSLIANALETTNFNYLQKKEKEIGYIEANKLFNSTKDKKFYNAGKSNQWKNLLTKKQVTKIENHFSKLMKEVGYLN